jgi:flagellar basal-body rod modification protein FlgD
MEILQTPTTLSSGAQPTASATSTASQITSDFEVFLQMLTAQMQYQDPLNPVDSTDYATQLATFSGVEQAVQTNDLLKELSAQMAVGGLTDMASWVGKEARSTAPAYFGGAPIQLFPQASDLADKTEIIVRDSAGVEVQRFAFAQGTKELSWDGAVNGGPQLPSGLYRFEVVGTTNGELIGQSKVDLYSRITEVRLERGQTMLVLDGGATIPSDAVTALRDAT